ncbi:MAG: acyl-CoA reductase [Saccharofermentans sp.]|nr:acyl-CoA reductase [Saccharofermentans sp.]
MILFDGKIYESSEQDRLLSELENKIPEILTQKQLSPEVIVEAVECLREDLLKGKFDELLESFPSDVVATYKAQAEVLLSKEHLHKKLETELGDTSEYVTDYIKGFQQIRVKRMPLGVLFHIAAGNMDFLPAYSLAEGLMTGNINILKLPSADNGLSLKLIMQIIEYRPELKDYIYVFDTSSSDIQGMRKMADLSNAISVWGSDMAIEAVRGLAPTGAKIIEWGQKLGFCYVTKLDEVEDADKELEGLANHIATTKQLLCSSCQVIYVDTKDMNELKSFAERFLPVMEAAANGNKTQEIGVRARDTLVSYTQRLKGYLGQEEKHDNVLRGRSCSLILSEDSTLELSPMMCNVLIKPLPRENVGKVLYQSRYHLQTAGLICPKEDRNSLAELFTQTGIIRVTKPADMSAYFPGESHDGEYALNRYTRVVNVEE